MKKYLLTALLLTATPAHAALYSQHIDYGVPECNDTRLKSLVLDKIKTQNEENPTVSILDKRREKLLNRDIKDFYEVSTQNFTSKQDFNAANAIITAKINKGLDNGLLRLCKSSSNGYSKHLYLLIYRHDYKTHVDIINYTPTQEDFYIEYN